MAHQFVVNATIKGVSLDDFRRLAADISLHSCMAKPFCSFSLWW